MRVPSAASVLPLFLFAAIAAYAPARANDSLTWRLRAGSDVVGEQFHLVDDDTIDVLTEFRAQLQTVWGHESRRWRNIRLDHRLGIGTLALRDDLTGAGAFAFDTTWRAELDVFSSLRHYLDTRSGSRSDFAEGRFGAVLRHRSDDGASWGIDQGIKGIAWRRRSPLYLNAYRHWHGLAVERQDFGGYAGGRVIAEREVVPDSAGLGFLGIAADGWAYRSYAASWDFSGDAAIFARQFRSRTSHPHELDANGRLRVGWRFRPSWSIDVSASVATTRYDPTSAIYYDTVGAQPAIELVWWPLWGSVRAGPTIAWQHSDAFPGESYAQWGAQAGTNLFSARWGFLDLLGQIGRRNYSDDAAAVFTDYLYWDLTLVLAARLPGGIDLDAFVIGRSEAHRSVNDDTRSLLLTLDLSRAIGR